MIPLALVNLSCKYMWRFYSGPVCVVAETGGISRKATGHPLIDHESQIDPIPGLLQTHAKRNQRQNPMDSTHWSRRGLPQQPQTNESTGSEIRIWLSASRFSYNARDPYRHPTLSVVLPRVSKTSCQGEREMLPVVARGALPIERFDC